MVTLRAVLGSHARQLLVSEATVKSRLSHIYTKLNVDTRVGAIAKAIEQRIIRT